MHQNDTKEGHQHNSIQLFFFFVIVDFSYLVSSFNPHHLSFRGCGESRAVPQPGRKTEQPFPTSPCSVLTQTLRFSHNFQLIKCLYVWHSNHENETTLHIHLPLFCPEILIYRDMPPYQNTQVIKYGGQKHRDTFQQLLLQRAGDWPLWSITNCERLLKRLLRAGGWGWSSRLKWNLPEKLWIS